MVHLLPAPALWTFNTGLHFVSNIKLLFFLPFVFTQSYRWREEGRKREEVTKENCSSVCRDRLACWAVVRLFFFFFFQVIHTNETSGCFSTQRTLPPPASGRATLLRGQVTCGGDTTRQEVACLYVKIKARQILFSRSYTVGEVERYALYYVNKREHPWEDAASTVCHRVSSALETQWFQFGQHRS